jgi:hypothetical protein
MTLFRETPDLLRNHRHSFQRRSASFRIHLSYCLLALALHTFPVIGAPAPKNIILSTLYSSKKNIKMRDKLRGQKAADVVRGGHTDFDGKQKSDVTVKHTTWGTSVRNALFPIHGDEVKKFLLIGSIKFFVILALTLTRDNKDTMVVTECGAEAIAFLKVAYQYCNVFHDS